VSQSDRSQDPVGYAVVGLGRISQAAMLPAFANTGDSSRLVALVSGNEKKRRVLAERYGLDPERDTFGYDDLAACLERDDVEAVYIAVPNHLHREYTERAAAAGVNVLCEKPMAPSVEDCRAMIDACENAGVRLMIAYRLHLEPANLHLVERIEGGALGEPRLFSSTFALQVDDDDVRLVPPDSGGGPLYDIGVYCINAARYLFRAEPEEVWATPVARKQPRFEEIEEAASCVLRFPGERLATFTCSFGAHDASLVTLVGDDGWIRLDNAFDFRGDRHLQQEGGRDPGTRTFPESDQFGPQLAYFSRCIREDRDPEPDGGEGLMDVRIIRALYESMETGRSVELDLHRGRRPEPDMAERYPALESPEMVDGSSSSA